ncbi:hypothetical protein P6144_09590 [Sphingomonas sp. HITSZ_GF]|uniref:hypothetical protein n=1 Tax=Sphingomonas sp. HITSZ_GF TaxID=3037247 RepID=UPI00240E0B92|nr:hypothetical protein [Sphingomonas sp. HITSZ_GF]MDG2533897.1 hypothetical protein [Sphingomonas sp. HITSZ_GF]
MFRKLTTTLAASTLLLASTAAQANSASALSLRNAPAAAATTSTRASTSARHDNSLFAAPIFIIGAIFVTFTVLEVTGAINIIGDDDEPDSP